MGMGSGFSCRGKISCFLGLDRPVRLGSSCRPGCRWLSAILPSFPGRLFMVGRLIKLPIPESKSKRGTFNYHRKHIRFMLIKFQLKLKNLLNNILRNLRLLETNSQGSIISIVFIRI